MSRDAGAVVMLAKSSLVLFLVAASAPAWAAGCRITPFSVMYGIDSQSRMDVSTGRPCGIRMGAPRGRTYSAGGGSDFTVSAQAQHGRVTLLGPNEISYQSAPGYTGPDQFTFETTGEVMPVRGPARRGTAHVTVDVVVGP